MSMSSVSSSPNFAGHKTAQKGQQNSKANSQPSPHQPQFGGGAAITLEEDVEHKAGSRVLPYALSAAAVGASFFALSRTSESNLVKLIKDKMVKEPTKGYFKRNGWNLANTGLTLGAIGKIGWDLLKDGPVSALKDLIEKGSNDVIQLNQKITESTKAYLGIK